MIRRPKPLNPGPRLLGGHPLGMTQGVGLQASRVIGLFMVMTLLRPTPGFAEDLAAHPSPYLRLHAEDPVAWRTWGDEALAEAKRRERPVFLSSGYYACHWCHVMHQESFRDAGIAERLNQQFIPVKIDRELQPELDAQLLRFTKATAGHGGWPLNVILTPTGYPVHGFVYEPRDALEERLEGFSAAWQDRSERLESAARRAARELFAAEPRSERETIPSRADSIRRLQAQLHERADPFQGGFGEVTKFPLVPLLQATRTLVAPREDPDLRDFLRQTEGSMARSGLRDPIHGGFFRYTEDPGWDVPHFEKMLYDQALLASLYLRGDRDSRTEESQRVAFDTLDFVRRTMQTREGGYVASLSAVDSEGRDGGNYQWVDKDWQVGLTADERRLVAVLWEWHDGDYGQYPAQTRTITEAANRLDWSEERAQRHYAALRAKLRAKRSVPPRDTKQIVGWNGLLLAAFAQAAAVETAPARFASASAALAQFLTERLQNEPEGGAGTSGARHSLPRAWVGTRGVGDGALADYAYLAYGLEQWRRIAPEASRERLRSAITRVLTEAWRRFHTDAGWRRSEATGLPIAMQRPVWPEKTLPSPVAMVLALTPCYPEAGLPDARRALHQAWPRVAADPARYPTLWRLAITPAGEAPGTGTLGCPSGWTEPTLGSTDPAPTAIASPPD